MFRYRLTAMTSGASAALALAATLLTAGPASAHVVRAYVNTDGVQRGFAEAYNNHTWLAACDTRADGIGVFARGWLNTGGYMDVPDSNGQAHDCGRASAPSGSRFTFIEAFSRDGGRSGRVEA
jgi:hypothetical protein